MLALGIGANTAIFSLVNAMLFQAPHYAEPAGVVQLFSQDRKHPASYRPFSYRTYRDIRDQHGVFTDVAAFDLALIGLGQKGETRRATELD